MRSLVEQGFLLQGFHLEYINGLRMWNGGSDDISNFVQCWLDFKLNRSSATKPTEVSDVNTSFHIKSGSSFQPLPYIST